MATGRALEGKSGAHWSQWREIGGVASRVDQKQKETSERNINEMAAPDLDAGEQHVAGVKAAIHCQQSRPEIYLHWTS